MDPAELWLYQARSDDGEKLDVIESHGAQRLVEHHDP